MNMTKDYLIRIADAIEVVKDTMKRLVDDEPRGDSDTLTEYCAKLAKLTSINDEILKALSALPSAEAEWIPCSERLPSESGNYLITVADLRLGHNGEHTVTMADFYAKAKKWNSIVDVYAWMPLPDPWKDGER